MSLRHRFAWAGPSGDPNDVQFGDVVERTTLDGAGDFDAVLVGEPYDGAVIGRKGARKGPAAIREALAATKTHHFDAGAVGGVGDLGDSAVLADALEGDTTAGVAAVQDVVASLARKVYARDALPVFLGGDNSLTVGNVRPLVGEGSVGVVSLDAHLDCREPRDGPTSGTPYRQLFEEGLDGLAVLGARHFETSTDYHHYLRDAGGEVVTAEEVGADPVDAADRALDAVGHAEQVYVSLDVDVLDVTAAPGASAPTPGGLATRELFVLLRLLASDERLAGFEVVELAPRLDEGGRTAVAAARAVAHLLAAAQRAAATAGGHDRAAELADVDAGAPDRIPGRADADTDGEGSGRGDPERTGRGDAADEAGGEDG